MIVVVCGVARQKKYTVPCTVLMIHCIVCDCVCVSCIRSTAISSKMTWSKAIQIYPCTHDLIFEFRAINVFACSNYSFRFFLHFSTKFDVDKYIHACWLFFFFGMTRRRTKKNEVNEWRRFSVKWKIHFPVDKKTRTRRTKEKKKKPSPLHLCG